MLLTRCSFCQHNNTPGARFCAECGSPMHLKVCANPACGKVSDVAATVCETCGEPFPKVALVSPGLADAAPPASGSIAPPPDKPRTALWPLIAVAVVAGSLPLLWANRAHLPAPKSGPFSNPDRIKPAPAPAPMPAPPAPLPITPAPVAAPAPVVAPAVTSDIDPTGPAPVSKAETPKKTSKPAARKKAEAKRPCTEALAALGLCEPKQAGK